MAHPSTYPPQTGHPLFRFADSIVKRATALKNRRDLRKLLSLQDHLLDDVGVNRSDIQRIVDLPLSHDAATELYQISLGRRNG